MAFELLKSSFENLIQGIKEPVQSEFSLISLVIMILAIFVKLYMYFYNHSVAKKINSVFEGLKADIVKGILSIGMSPFFMNTAACLIVILINQGLQRHGGDLAIGAYGIVNRISFVFVMIVMGLNQGMQPIAGYNFGAREFQRVDRVLKLTIFCATAIMTLGFLVAELFPRQLVMIFTTDEELIQHSISGMRIVFMMFPIIGFQMVTSNFFQSVGMAGKAIFLSLTRQLLFLLPCLLILPHFFQTNGIWMSMPVADALSSIVSFFMLYSQIKKFKTADQYGN